MIEYNKSPLMIIISSPSGAGKTTLCKMLLKNHSFFSFSISHTTRIKRNNETEGNDYYFVSNDNFKKMIDAQEFVEWATVHNNYYGTSKKEINRLLNENKNILFDVNYEGAKNIQLHYPEAISIFILPPSLKKLKERLEKRGTENSEQLKVRFKNSIDELNHYKIFNYLVVNDDLNNAFNQIQYIIEAEKCKTFRKNFIVQNLLTEELE